MKNSETFEATLDQINSCHALIKLVEAEEIELRKKLHSKKRLTYIGRHKNLIGYREFFQMNELKKEDAALEFDIEINEKAIGKRALKGGQI